MVPEKFRDDKNRKIRTIMSQPEYVTKGAGLNGDIPYYSAGPGGGGPVNVTAYPSHSVQGYALPAGAYGGGGPPAYAGGVQGSNVAVTFRDEDHQNLMVSAFTLARSLKILAVFLGVWNFIVFLVTGYAAYLVLLVGPIAGYFGARDYHKNLTYCFVAYFIFDLAVNLYLFFIGFFFNIIGVIADCFVLRYVYLFINILKMLQVEDIEFLRNPPQESVVVTQRRGWF